MARTDARVRRIVDALAAAYGPRHPQRPKPKRRPPLDELVLTILSQHTSDLNRDRAWQQLRSRYPAWEQVRVARSQSIARAISPGGLAKQKAPRIKNVLAEIERREGRLSLDSLRRLDDAEAREYLVSLPGIGPKTAACVLAFSLGRPVLAIDTHVHRIARRLGLIGDRVSAEAAQGALEALVAPDDRVELHLNLIAHGRELCRAKRPRCRTCPLLRDCRAGLAMIEAGEAGP